MVSQDENKIVLTSDHIPMITCSKCGKVFPSRGKKDEYALDGILPVYCDECQEGLIKKLIGGPLDGGKVSS